MAHRGGRGYGGPGRGVPSERGTGRGGGDFRGGRGGHPDSRAEFKGRGGGGGGRGGGGGGRGGFREQGGVFAEGQPANIDSRLSDNSQDTLIASLKSLSIKSGEFPSRPGFGTRGQPIKLRANFFPVNISKGAFYMYDVAITPVKGTAVRRVKRRIFQLAETTPGWTSLGLKGNVAHDHSAKLIAAKKLASQFSIVVPFTDDREEEKNKKNAAIEYTLTFTFIQEIETQSLLSYVSGDAQFRVYDIQPVIAALNIILAAYPNRSDGPGVMVGRNKIFFPTAAAPVSLGGGLEAWKGFYSSVRPTHKQLMVNVNVCVSAFYVPQNLASAMIDFLDSTFGARPSAFVRGIRIKTTHLGYKKTIKSASNMNAKQYIFEAAEFGGKISVEAYFKKKYNIALKHPNLPLVDVGGQKSNLLPPEVCMILPNQAFRGKLTDTNTAAMITVAANPPNVNANSIVGPGLTELGFRQGQTPLGAFGVSIGTEMTVVPGRILPPPGIQYGKGTPKVNDRASWNLAEVKFLRGGTLKNWAVLIIQDGNPRDEFADPKDPELKLIIDGFAKVCKNSGINVDAGTPTIVVARLPPKNWEDPVRGAAIAQISEAVRSINTKPSLLMVFLSNGDKHIYSGIKHLFDVSLDLATVCVQSSKIRKERGQVQYFANVALKINMKMGGINHVLDPMSMQWLKQGLTMLVGIDVTHPGPGSVKGTPSIAAVVASYDVSYAQYPASMQIQETKKEMVTHLDEMMKERLLLYKARNKALPQRILIYRDGVSEGQFRIVIDEELPLIKAAFRTFDTSTSLYNPKLTILICSKRHHTRFMPTASGHADQNGNPRPGTVVDRGVTSIYDYDFFLQAHGALQGTARPTHYYVVHDTIGFKADDLQSLTNAVSYTFARATKAVSLAAPAYYADIACERGRCYLHRLLHGIGSSVGSSASGAEEQVMKEAYEMWRGGVRGKAMKDTMYYL